MAQTLSYVQKELNRLKQEAADATVQMRLLEQALASVIKQGTKGGGIASPVAAAGLAQRTLASPGTAGGIAGTPVGYKAIVGSEVGAKAKGIEKEYGRLQAKIAQGVVAKEQLIKAEMVVAAALKEQAIQAARVAASDAVTAEVKAKRIATELAAAEASKTSVKTLGQRISAWKKEEAAALALAEAEKKAELSLGKLSAGVTTAASDIKAKTGGRGGTGETQQEQYTQARLETIFAKRPGAAKQISATAAKSQFRPEDIKKVTEYANSYTQLQYAVQGANGVMRKMVLTTDRAGNVFTSTQKQFRTFFGAIRRNVTEMIKWSAATLVVWGAIRKLGDLLQIAIDNETKLASIAVILGEEHADLTKVFNSAAEAALATGEAIDGVLEGYVQAYRATGNITDETERARQAQVLLIDALTLSKLSSMTTAQAMDTLTGALRQAGLGFEEGYKLLDKWVAVSRQANVSIETLAESFAITATSASNAGLTWDELNGIIATLAESTTLSATESGNAIRAFIGGFSTDLSVKELSKFGIAVTDTTGETRGFLDVMKEIAVMFEQGIISEGELNKIARAIGGRGARRGAQVATTIKNLSRAQEVAEVSAKAHGDAQRALNIQLDTVQTAITKLSNSFQKLARAMGAEGGVLDAAGLILDIFTKLVDATASLVKNLGDLTPVLMVMGGLFAATSAQTRGLLATNVAAGVGGLIGRFGGAAGVGTGGAQALSIEQQRLTAGQAGGFAAAGMPIGRGQQATNWLTQPGIGRNAGTRLGQGVGVGFAAYTAGKNIAEGDMAGAGLSLAGAAIGALLSGGSPIGMIIGSAAGEAFANATFNYKTEFSKFFGEIFDEVEPGKKAGEITDEDEAIAAVFAEVGLGSEGLGKFFSKMLTTAGNIGYQGMQVIGNVTGGVALGDWQYRKDLPGAELDPQQLALGLVSGTEQAASVYNIRAAQEAAKGFEAGTKPSGEKFAITDAQAELLTEWEDFLIDLEATQAEIVRAGATSGEITGADLTDKLDKIPKLQAILTKYEVLFGDEIRKVNDELLTAADSMEYFTNIVVYGTPQQTIRLNAVAQAVADIANAIELAKDAGTPDKVILVSETGELETVAENVALERQWDLLTNIGIEMESMTRGINQARIKFPTIVTLDIREGDLDKVLEAGEPAQDKYWQAFWDEGINTEFSEEELEDALAGVMLQAGKDGGMRYVEGWEISVLQRVASDLIEQGIIEAPEKDTKRGLRTFDIPSTQWGAAEAEYQKVKALAESAGYIPDEETFAALFTDYIAFPIKADLTLLNIAMQELIEVNKKELDGIYNLPTDASFYVPFSAMALAFVNKGGGGGAGLPGGMGIDGREDERDRRGRPSGYVPSDIRRRLPPVERTMKDVIKEGFETVLEPSRVSQDTFTGHRGAQRPMDGFEGLQLPSLTDMLLNYMKLGNLKRDIDLIRPDAPLEQLPGGTFGAEVLNTFRDLINSLFGLNGEDPTITTKLQIESTTTTIVQLDGQVIANAIKPYLLNDEIRYEGVSGGVVKRYVI
jgi:TP901 family phage tail tape measure protein